MESYSNFKNVLSISDYSKVRKHKQIVNSVLSATRIGSLKLNDKLPSVNELSIDFNISRDTVVRAYSFLKENDIIDSVPGKGYYVKSISSDYKVRVFLLFNNLSPQMKKIYDAFVETLKDTVVVDLYIYQNDYSLFKKHIQDSSSKDYMHYVIATNFDENPVDCMGFLKNKLPVDKLILLGNGSEELKNKVACVYENFEADFFKVLEGLESCLKKYKGIKLVSPKSSKIPKEIKDSFERFCKEYKYSFDVVQDLKNEKIEKHIVYVDFEDDQSLVSLIKKIGSTEFVIGKDIGIVSYDDNPLKELLEGGITVITKVFEKIGYQAANMILKTERKLIFDPLNVILRKSL